VRTWPLPFVKISSFLSVRPVALAVESRFRRRHEVVHRPAQQLRARAAAHRAIRVVDQNETVIAILREDRVRHGVDQGVEKLPGVRNLHLGLLARMGVDEHAYYATRAVCEAHRRLRFDAPALAAVGEDLRLLAHQRPIGRQHLVVLAEALGGSPRAQHAGVVFAEQISAGSSEHPAELVVDVHPAVLRIFDEDRRGQCIDQIVEELPVALDRLRRFALPSDVLVDADQVFRAVGELERHFGLVQPRRISAAEMHQLVEDHRVRFGKCALVVGPRTPGHFWIEDVVVRLAQELVSAVLVQLLECSVLHHPAMVSILHEH